MSEPIKAFPNHGNSNWGMQPDYGMDLRDWFAGQAVGVMFDINRQYLANVVKNKDYPINEATARDCYAFADAMIAARNGETK